jgi:hypothetical protein
MNSAPIYTNGHFNQINDLLYKLERLGVIDYSLYLSSSTRLWMKHAATYPNNSSTYTSISSTSYTGIYTIATTDTTFLGNK